MSFAEMVVAIVAVLAGCSIAGLAIVLSFVGGKKKNQASGDEVKVIQEIYDGLQRMQKRIEAVETIVLDKAAKEDEKVER